MRERVTPSGTKVSIKRLADIDDNVGEGMVVDIIEAYVGREPVAYIKVKYVSSEIKDRLYPDAFHFALKTSSSYYQLKNLMEKTPEDQFKRKDYIQALRYGNKRLSLAESKEIESFSLPKLQERWEACKQQIAREDSYSYQEYLKTWLDKPSIDYVRVRDKSDTANGPYYKDGIRQEGVPTRDYQREGIGTIIYEEMAIWLAERGLHLWKSFNPSLSAKMTWEKLDRLYGLESVPAPKNYTSSERQYLDGSKIRISLGEPSLLPLTSDLPTPDISDSKSAISLESL
jgi:hypothetical protein